MALKWSYDPPIMKRWRETQLKRAMKRPAFKRQQDRENQRERAHRDRERLSTRIERAWLASPPCDLTRMLRRQLIGRARAMLGRGEVECCDQLLELLPHADRDAILAEFFPEDFA